MVPINELKQCMTRAGIFGFAISKFCHQQEPCSVIFPQIYQDTKVCFYSYVLIFCLSVYLRMKYDRKLFFDIKEKTEQEPKRWHKNCFAVTDNKVRKALMSYYYVNNYFCQSQSINDDFDQFVIHYFGQLVDNDKNQVIVVTFLVSRLCSTYKKVHQKVFQIMYQKWQQL